MPWERSHRRSAADLHGSSCSIVLRSTSSAVAVPAKHAMSNAATKALVISKYLVSVLRRIGALSEFKRFMATRQLLNGIWPLYLEQGRRRACDKSCMYGSSRRICRTSLGIVNSTLPAMRRTVWGIIGKAARPRAPVAERPVCAPA